MCKKPKMPPMPEMPLPRAPERQPERSAVQSAATMNVRAQTGANRPAAQVMANTATQAPTGNLGSRWLGLVRNGITGVFSRGTSAPTGGSSILGG